MQNHQVGGYKQQAELLLLVCLMLMRARRLKTILRSFRRKHACQAEQKICLQSFSPLLHPDLQLSQGQPIGSSSAQPPKITEQCDNSVLLVFAVEGGAKPSST